MRTKKEEFLEYFQREDKERAVSWAIEGLKRGDHSIEELYGQILTEALHSIDNCKDDQHDCIWREHVKTAIVRTIIECCYPYVMAEVAAAASAGQRKKKVIIACPERELHEIGARMAADIFTLKGYHSIFIGSNTPREQLYAAVAVEKPDYLVISVTDYYLISETKKLIERLKPVLGDSRLILAGRAFERNPALFVEFGAYRQLFSYQDIETLEEGAR